MRIKTAAQQYSTLAHYTVILQCRPNSCNAQPRAGAHLYKGNQNKGNPHKGKAELTSLSFESYLQQLLIAVFLCGFSTQMTAEILLRYRKSSAGTASNHSKLQSSSRKLQTSQEKENLLTMVRHVATQWAATCPAASHGQT